MNAMKDGFPPLCWLDDCVNARGLPHASHASCAPRRRPEALLASLNVALWGENGHTYAPGVVDRVYRWLDEHAHPETCVCAGVLCPNGYIIRGHRHPDCMATFGYMFPHERVTQEMQGFVTSRNRWVSRKEGARLQDAAGIVSIVSQRPIGRLLLSEDLY